MSTRCGVFYKTTNGKYRGSYIHHDGYLEGVGQCLQRYYDDPKLIEVLVESSSYYSSLLSTTTDSLEDIVRVEHDNYEFDNLQNLLAYCAESDLEFAYIYEEGRFITAYGGFGCVRELEGLLKDL